MKDLSFILDNALEKEEFLHYQDYLKNIAIYKTIEADGNKKFYITNAPYGLQEKITKLIEKILNKKINIISAFVRKATKFLDTNWAIHSDLYVGQEESPTHGAVFYISHKEDELNGTALWKHKELGYKMPRDLGQERTMELSDRDYNDLDKWELSSVIGGIENRLVSYPAEFFHSKFPRQAWGTTQKDCRIIFALFYSTD